LLIVSELDDVCLSFRPRQSAKFVTSRCENQASQWCYCILWWGMGSESVLGKPPSQLLVRWTIHWFYAFISYYKLIVRSFLYMYPMSKDYTRHSHLWLKVMIFLIIIVVCCIRHSFYRIAVLTDRHHSK
jgi:hypothetical protein